MTVLLIDAGNTCLKSAVFIKGVGLTHYHRYAYDDLNDWCHVVTSEVPVTQILVAGVAKQTSYHNALQRVQVTFKASVKIIRSELEKNGINNGYADPVQLGIDRWLAMLAAWQHQAIAQLVVDIGTAMTIDVINASGQHQGGVIVPGIQLMKNALLHNTAALNPTSIQLQSALADNTQHAIEAGIFLALTGAIRTIQQQTRIDYIALTGGDAMLWLNALNNVQSTHIQHYPHLVLEGLSLYRDENVYNTHFTNEII